jgi:ABC-type antimicrobial peptide transport system permease subunit
VASLEQQLGTYLAQRRFQTSVLTGFSLVALLMAAVGIYGLIQYSTATRTQEIGIRMAVGAQAGEIFSMILVAVAACCFPARRAMKIEPIVALRQE